MLKVIPHTFQDYNTLQTIDVTIFINFILLKDIEA